MLYGATESHKHKEFMILNIKMHITRIEILCICIENSFEFWSCSVPYEFLNLEPLEDEMFVKGTLLKLLQQAYRAEL